MSALAKLRCVRVGSMNPPKLEGVRMALSAYAKEVETIPVDVESGVPDQPIGYPQIQDGARNRARAARDSGECDLAVGYEDGLVEIPGAGWWNVGCAAVVDAERSGLGFSSGFAYPPPCVVPAVEERQPIGGVFDRFWRSRRSDPERDPSALSVGNIGKLTGGALPRAEYTRHAVLCALVSWLHPDLYAPGASP